MPQARILLSGMSGATGAGLLPSLAAAGYRFTRLLRRAVAAGDAQIEWDPAKPLPAELVGGFGAVIHLAGEPIMGRWTAAKKARIRHSRVQGTRTLALALAQTPRRPQLLIAASAVGYYGDRGEEILREDSPSGKGFLAEVCREWEAAAQPAREAGIRVVHLRLGVILSMEGGALPAMLRPFRLGLGGKIGSGRQYMSWVSIDDVVGAIHHILKNDSVTGPLNVVAPTPVSNAEFTRTLAEVLSRPAVLPMPAFAARLVFGEMADELLLSSQRVEPAKLNSVGYQFQHPTLREALQDLLRR